MKKFEMLDILLQDNNGFIKTSGAVGAGVSKTKNIKIQKI
jgi:hypothetical protein